MGDVESLSVSSVQYRHTRYIAVGNAVNGFAGYPLCLDVQSVVEMIGAQLAKVGAEQNREIERRTEVVVGDILGLSGEYPRQGQYQYHFLSHFFVFVKRLQRY